MTKDQRIVYLEGQVANYSNQVKLLGESNETLDKRNGELKEKVAGLQDELKAQQEVNTPLCHDVLRLEGEVAELKRQIRIERHNRWKDQDCKCDLCSPTLDDIHKAKANTTQQFKEPIIGDE